MLHGSSLPRRKRRGPRFSSFEGRPEVRNCHAPCLPDPTARFIGAPRTNGNDIPSGRQRETSSRSMKVRAGKSRRCLGFFIRRGRGRFRIFEQGNYCVGRRRCLEFLKGGEDLEFSKGGGFYLCFIAFLVWLVMRLLYENGCLEFLEEGKNLEKNFSKSKEE